MEELYHKKQIHQVLETCIPRYTSILDKESLDNVLLCKMCFHYYKFKSMLHDKCPLRVSPIFRDIPSNITLLALICPPWNITDDTPYYIGIPIHILLI